MFWLIVIFMTLAAISLAVVPLVRKNTYVGPGHDSYSASILESQLSELEQDLAAGTITEEDYRQARAETERRFIETTRGEEQRARGGRSTATAIAMAVAIPLVAVVTYQSVGAGPDAGTEVQIASAGHPGMDIDIEAMVRRLEARLESNPDDPDGWVMLGRSLSVLDDLKGAERAYRRAVEGGIRDASVYSTYADIMGYNRGTLAGEPYILLRRALELDPNHDQALWLAGTAAYRGRDYTSALEYWERLERLLPPNSESAEIIADNIAAVRREMAQ